MRLKDLYIQKTWRLFPKAKEKFTKNKFTVADPFLLEDYVILILTGGLALSTILISLILFPLMVFISVAFNLPAFSIFFVLIPTNCASLMYLTTSINTKLVKLESVLKGEKEQNSYDPDELKLTSGNIIMTIFLWLSLGFFSGLIIFSN